MSKIIFIFIFCFPLFNNCILAQYSVDIIPDNLMKNADQVIRNSTIDIELKSISKGKIKVTKVITFLNNSNQTYPVINYNKGEKITKIKATIFDSKGQKFKELRKNNILDQANCGYDLISDNRNKVLNFKYGKYPYTIKYSYVKTLNNASLMFLQGFYIQDEFNQSIEASSYTIHCSEDVNVKYKATNTDIFPSISEEKKYKIYSWSVKDLPATKHEPYMPKAKDILPVVNVQMQNFKFDEYIGSNDSWSSFGNFLTKLHYNRQHLTPQIKQVVHNLTKDLNTDADKIDVLYKYLQKNYRYVSVQLGIGGWQPMKAFSVCTSKYGDCKALANYMNALLYEVNIVSNPIIIYSGDEDRGLDTSFVSPSFNHEILYIPKSNIWLDCTSSFSPTNYINYRNSGRWALLLDGQKSHLIRTPDMDEKNNIRTSHSVITMVGGKMNVKFKGKLYGRNYEVLAFLNDYEDEIIKKYALKAISPKSGSLLDCSLKNIKNKAILEINASLNIGIKNRNNGLVLKANPLFSKAVVPKKINDRIYPFEIKHAETVVDTFDYKLTPNILANYKDSSNDKHVESPFGAYNLCISKYASGIRIIRSYITYKYKGSAKEYDAYRTFVKKVARFDNSTIFIELQDNSQ